MDRVRGDSHAQPRHSHTFVQFPAGSVGKANRDAGAGLGSVVCVVWSSGDGDNALLSREMARRGGGQSLAGWRETREKD